MAKKNIMDNVNTRPIYDAISQASDDTPETSPEVKKTTKKERRSATPEEIAAAQENMDTRGRKGAKLLRINASFSKSNYEYIVIMSRVAGMDKSQFINRIVTEYREAHADQYEQTRKLYDQIMGD